MMVNIHRISPTLDLIKRGLGHLYGGQDRLTGLDPFSRAQANNLLRNGHKPVTLKLTDIRQMGYADIAKALAFYGIRAIDLDLYVHASSGARTLNVSWPKALQP